MTLVISDILLFCFSAGFQSFVVPHCSWKYYGCPLSYVVELSTLSSSISRGKDFCFWVGITGKSKDKALSKISSYDISLVTRFYALQLDYSLIK